MSRILAVGHFGNFELLPRAAQVVPQYRTVTTYRALNIHAANELLLKLREGGGCLFIERRTGRAALQAALREESSLLGLLSDQHGGKRGAYLPFFGHYCCTTKAPAVLALRFNLPLHTAICFRVRPGYWRVEVGDEIPTRDRDRPRSVEAITRDVNRAFEHAIRRDPANWFWVHQRWKPASIPSPVALADRSKLALDPRENRA